jgi:hypothetical protein
MGMPSNWSTMTDAEKRAWADAETAPKPKATAPAAPAPTTDPIADILARKGGYLPSPRGGEGHTDHK